MNNNQFEKLLNLLPKIDGKNDFRGVIQIYGIANNLRPSMNDESISDFLSDENNKNMFIKWIKNEKIKSLDVVGLFVQNKSYGRKFFNRRKGEDIDQLNGRTLGYPEVFSSKDFENIHAGKLIYYSYIYYGLKKPHKLIVSCERESFIFGYWKKHFVCNCEDPEFEKVFNIYSDIEMLAGIRIDIMETRDKKTRKIYSMEKYFDN